MTNNGVDESVLRKIKKALALADSAKNPSSEEAQTAMLKAQELMAKYGVSVSDIKDVNTNPANAVKKEVSHSAVQPESEKNAWWKKSLSLVIADNFRCYAYTTRYGAGYTKISFMGVKEDVELAVEVFNYAVEIIEYQARKYRKDRKKELAKGLPDFKGLTDMVEYAASVGVSYGRIVKLQGQYLDGSESDALFKKYLTLEIKDAMGLKIDGPALRNTYIKGFIRGLKERFEEQVKVNSWALVLVKDALVEKAYAEMDFKKGSASTVRTTQDTAAYTSGFKEGKSFSGSAPKGKLNEGKRSLNGGK